MGCYVVVVGGFFFFKQKTAYEMRISDWSSDVCSSDLEPRRRGQVHQDLAWVAQDRSSDRLEVGPRLPRDPYGVVRYTSYAGQRMVGCGRLRPQIGRATCRERVCQYV